MAEEQAEYREVEASDVVRASEEEKSAVARSDPGYIFWEEVDGLDVGRCPTFVKLTDQQQQFVLHLVAGQHFFNVRAAALAAGYGVTSARRVMKNARVRAAVREVMACVGVRPERVLFKIVQYAAGVDVADLEPYLQGEASLAQLRARGVNTRAVKKARRTVERDGSEHFLVECFDPGPFLQQLVRILGMGGEDSMHLRVSHELDLSGMGSEDLSRLEHALSRRREGEGGDGQGASSSSSSVPTEPVW